jgi:hypothetical protein
MDPDPVALLDELVAGCWVTTDDLLDAHALSAAMATSIAVASLRTLVDGRLAGISSKCDGPRPGTSPGQSPD